jgi:predicted phage terminase large subunit-like protein
MSSAQIDLSGLTDEEKAELRWRLEERERYAAATEQEQQKIRETARLQADFTAFVKAAWPILDPGNTLSWSWHYNLIAEYLTLAAEKKCRRLIINIPPRTLKSILITVMFPVWVWTRSPQASFACASYADKLSTEHSVKRRRLIESDWFRGLWGDRIWLQKDQNEKTKFQNNYQAQMIATSVGGTATGLGGNFLIVDDGLKPDEAVSEAAVTALHGWFDNTWRSRLNNPAEDVMIIVEQRIGELDLTGHCASVDKDLVAKGEKPQWTVLCIPMEADEEAVDKNTLMQRFVFPVSGMIKDRPLGDVLQPNRFPPEVVAAWKILRITWATQYQGRPSPLEGNMIKRSDVMYYGGRDPDTGDADERLPEKFDLILTSVDAAFKDLKTSDYVCVGTIGVKGRKRYILEVVNKHLDAPATETEARRQREKYKSSAVLIEDKANGSAVIKSMRRNVSGVVPIEPEGGKISRFFAMCGEWQAHDWYLDRTAAWEDQTVTQLTKFPGVKNDDIADMISQAAIYLRSHTSGFLALWKKEVAEYKFEPKTLEAAQMESSSTWQEKTAQKPLAPNSEVPKIQDVAECHGCGNKYLSKGADGYWKCNVCGRSSTDA